MGKRTCAARAAVIAIVAACGSGASDAPDGGAADDTPSIDAPMIRDEDGDGLDDRDEQALAVAYLPYLSLDPNDGCPLDGLVARVRPHPADPSKVLIVYSHLFQRDCGLNGHVGDNEGFGIAIDPAIAPPAGILAIRTASHQGTPCERVTECSTCAGDSRANCDLAGDAGGLWPVLFASKGKHGQYARRSSCSLVGTCLDQCTLNAQRESPPVVNVGEPMAPLTHDLTSDGFITPANGWTEPALMNFDPWDPAKDFGSAGNIAGDLQDPEFEVAPCP